ncbi:YeiH family protein [Novosphingobium album (ex Liu et al. 2023)]|uniref:Sulfate exporter family transporter n=1 Tax=Novosphingobium album (ex Liu et al. 2023) TaxID=3031130 RepID=A0ABT5WME6_9SPHN|nr:putative sulfate exporter family transporter [Novosphingobium album (ex Liu et al. 2023)]MDE8651213.1 putative sulfate exporter family transporter [Novosphingobium album (ex Liu et al. 2023)]
MKAQLASPSLLPDRLLPRSLVPGLALSGAVAAAALVLERLEIALVGKPWLEALVIAILLGAIIRTVRAPSRAFAPGIHCAAKTMLELAVAMMGATISFGAIAAAGLPLIASIVATVIGAIIASFLIGRMVGLPGKMALLVACGNAICGNSAIAAVAPVIDAKSDDVATSIAFTAVLGIVVVIALPFVAYALHLTPLAGGILAGLTVYAVPQVIAAAGPLGATAVQAGTLVKLVRVLMLGPLVTGLSLLRARHRASEQPTAAHHSILRLMPPFILAFLALAAVNSLGLLPRMVAAPAHVLSGLLTVLAMAGLGLGVDLRSVSAAGPRVVFVVTASLAILGAMALATLRMMGLA